MLLWLFLALLGLTSALDRRALPCGWKDERCCVVADIPKTDRDYYESGDFFDSHDWADPKGWCWGSQLFCIGNVCKTEAALTCGKLGLRCCKSTEAGGDKNKPLQCLDSTYCVNGKCAANAALPCGENTERCCQLKDLLTNYNYDDDAYVDDTPDRCFGRSSCIQGKCLKCNAEGDQCCGVGLNQFCKNNFNCVKGKCVRCGSVGLSCCDLTQIPDTSDTYYDYGVKDAPCTPGLDCQQGKCNYCGYEGNPCCGTACKVNGLVCNPKTMRCEACGLKDELCCPGARCDKAYLKCGGGRCRCGQQG